MEEHLHVLIGRIHAVPPRIVYAFAGAGSLALWWLHGVAGSSRTLLEAIDCYAPRSLEPLLGTPITRTGMGYRWSSASILASRRGRSTGLVS